MTIRNLGPTRRTFLGAAAAGAAFGTLPGLIRPASAANEFKIGLFIALSGPASLFGPTQRACAELAAEEVNKAGGILGRQIKLIPTDAGGPPAESTKSAIRLMLEEKVDVFVGSHDSATREALVATIKGKVPTSTRRSMKAASARPTTIASPRRRSSRPGPRSAG